MLNDIIDEQSRKSVFLSFARTMRKNGILIFDVREWTNSTTRKEREPVFEKVVDLEHGILKFLSETKLKYSTKLLLVSEKLNFEHNDGTSIESAYDFKMNCWTKKELQENVDNAGFVFIEYFGSFDLNKPIGSTDRIIAIASLGLKQTTYLTS